MVGDDLFVTEDTYIYKVGSLVTTVDLLVKRIAAKDNYIKELEGKLYPPPINNGPTNKDEADKESNS